MKKYSLSSVVCVSAYTEVFAESREEAINIAEGRDVRIDTNYGRDRASVWLISDADGEPQEIEVENE